MFNKCCEKENCECGCKKTPKLINLALIFLSIFLISQALIGFQKLPNVGKEVYPQSTIAVSGTGDAYAIPDIATFSFSVIETDKTIKTAQDKANAKINSALAMIRASGVADKDIQTTNYNVYPKYEYSNAVCPPIPMGMGYAGVTVSPSSPYYCPSGKQVLIGYEVDQSITIKVRDIEKAADLVTKVGAIGVDNISGLEFSVDNREQFVAQARALAITDAKAKAKELAKQLGVRLGSIISFSENGNYPVYYGAMGKGGADVAVSSVTPVAKLPQGQNKITSDVSITYEIK